jgi:nucleolar protein 4
VSLHLQAPTIFATPDQPFFYLPQLYSSSESTTTLLISSLPLKYTSDSLSTLLSSVGPIRVAFIVTSQDEEKRSKGYGFGKFVLKDDAEKAIKELNGTLIDGKRITVQWAKRRQRVNKNEETDDAAVAEQPVAPVEEVKENVVQAYAARRATHREQREGGGQIDNKADSRTVILEGGLDTSLPEHKKALQNRLKKVVTGINTGMGTLNVHDLVIRSSTIKGKSTDMETGTLEDVIKPITFIETPSPRAAASLAEKLHNSVLKGYLCLCKNKFESDLLVRKGSRQAVGRLIVRNLGFDVSYFEFAASMNIDWTDPKQCLRYTNRSMRMISQLCLRHSV